jgi:hypothetical protein
MPIPQTGAVFLKRLHLGEDGSQASHYRWVCGLAVGGWLNQHLLDEIADEVLASGERTFGQYRSILS